VAKTVIKVENLYKQFRPGTVGSVTIIHYLNRLWQTNIRGKEIQLMDVFYYQNQ